MKVVVVGIGNVGKPIAETLDKNGDEVIGIDVDNKVKKLQSEFKGTDVKVMSKQTLLRYNKLLENTNLFFNCVETIKSKGVLQEYAQICPQEATWIITSSVMTPTAKAFEEYNENNKKKFMYNFMHFLFDPSRISSKGQNTAFVKGNCEYNTYLQSRDMVEKFGSRIIEIPTYDDHDLATADTQAGTQTGYLSMAYTWATEGIYPWENRSSIGGIDNVKVLMALRLLGGKPHVSSALAILNPHAKKRIQAYAQSVRDLYTLGDDRKNKDMLRKRLLEAGKFIFENYETPIALDDKIMGEYSLGLPSKFRKPNSHLSLWSMIDAWKYLEINPYDNLICETPLFKLWLGICEYLYKNEELREESLDAFFDKNIRKVDRAFVLRNNNLEKIITDEEISIQKKIELYNSKFDKIKEFFGQERINEALEKSNELIYRIAA